MDVTTYALLKAYIKKALIDGGNVTPEEREKINKIIIDGTGINFLADDGTYKQVQQGTTNYENLNQKPSINGIELIGNKNASQLGFATVSSTGNYEDLVNLPTPIVYLSQLQNDTGFITNTVGNLVNYYTKAQAYTKMEVNQMIGNLSTLSVEIVTELPTENISLNTIYLIKDEATSIYAQWMYLNNVWSNIGSTEIDLTQYYTKIEVSNLLLNKVDKEFGMGLSQENYTTEEADKLAGLSNYTLPKATTEILGGVRVDGVTIFADENGVISASSGGGGLAPSNVSNINLIAGNGQITISWKDPEDTIVDGVTLSKWKGTKLVQKIGGYPLSPTDGTVIVDNQIRNNYETNGIIISPLTNDIVYYYQLFPYSEEGVINRNILNRAEGTPTEITFKTMTVIIDTTNSNPETALTYADDALTMTPSSYEWDEWFGIYPCLFKDGVEVGKLNPNNFSQFEDGTPADITSGNAGDVMIAFPRMGLKIETIGTNVYIKMTNNLNDNNFDYFAHTRGEINKNIFYLGAYKSFIRSNKNHSLSDKYISMGETYSNYRIYSNNMGIGYDMISFYQLLYIQSMYTLKYKNLNSQQVSGMGLVNKLIDGFITGNTNFRGMNYVGTSDGQDHMKLFGLEDIYGTAYEYTDGILINDSLSVMTATNNFNTIGTGYEYTGINLSVKNGFLTKTIGNNKTGFLGDIAEGSGTTYYCDYFNTSNGIMVHGGYFLSSSYAGMFQFSFINPNSSISLQRLTRLMYL